MDWRERLYQEYVQSGQAADGSCATVEESSIARRRDGIQRTLKRFMPSRKDLRIVDLGCGHGDYVYHLRELGYENVEGVDVSQEQIELARALGLEGIVCDEIEEYLRGQEPDSIDVVLLIDVLEHLDRSKLFSVMDEVSRVLRSGGTCLVHVPNALGLFGMRVRYGDLTHELAFTPSTMNQLFNTVGFSDVDCYECIPGGRFRGPLWKIGILPFRAMLWLEKPDERIILSQNMYVRAIR
ncbi:class I SAM-dependent methyltransferase [Salinibacter ruber]|uniref:class I SAM-dependent methyltransferase n=1 Tax=Salinibacter ruber TaxID=146919 RepID=UPI002342F06B|nr:class I SAM-dependent methyltransferase [Salinibacter ruber]